MRVGHFAHSIWAPGGISNYIRRIADEQRAMGFEVSFFSFEESFSDIRGQELVPDSRGLLEAASGLDILHLHQEISEVVGGSVPLVRTMHENQASCPSGSRFLRERARPCDRIAGPLVCTWGLFVDRCGSIKPSSIARYRDRFKAEQRVTPQMQTTTVSEFLRTRMIAAGFPANRIRTILHAAPRLTDDHALPSPPPGGLARFLFVGRVVPSKGVQWLLKAAAASHGEFAIDIAGEGYQLDAMRALAKQLGLAERVEFHGWLPSGEISALMRRSRAVVFPSLWHEPAGLVTLEAAAHARAVIASRVGGIPEYADSTYTRLLESNNVEALASALDELVENRDIAERMGAAGLEYVRKNHDMATHMNQLHELYQRTIDEHVS